MADIEKRIKELAVKGRDGKLTVEDCWVVTSRLPMAVFWFSDVYPNHQPTAEVRSWACMPLKIAPMAVDGQVVILPMMYLALSYDHRLVDGP
nr:2-oxo acid dehydrogenase subunit E2 [Pectobacterium parmentieri]